ncbi:hypothetical protein DYBT9623_03835 [Dyadobacter sp. CECT 9623]|uniref:Uncharacterized protein n=1 Tax=Dyadobacter linearis TaxID=2823330 RepID=A0ABN7RF84_9BACT|nr:hypothetical protein DYBT9623_03835 [Dyadobacter sp. CECT 9623]
MIRGETQTFYNLSKQLPFLRYVGLWRNFGSLNKLELPYAYPPSEKAPRFF